MFFVFSKDIKSEHIEKASSLPKKNVEPRPTWTDEEERRLNYLKLRRSEAYDQTIWIHNQITYFSYELSKATDEEDKAKNSRILSHWQNKMEYERGIMKEAYEEMKPLLEKKERFEEYDEDEDEDDE